ncbi:unnamed protein product [Notodromas monacha]|uniref:Aminotransferase class I/classII large domain-containing protein n=1 Tax=Notodromas monacha TaxID=399045 RepID=A0A7R9GAD0_9CRUS|nr:unnamed protein product [Notodromas monacha]CAG0913864.1 unnamed protein product [Notodromas monacha]
MFAHPVRSLCFNRCAVGRIANFSSVAAMASNKFRLPDKYQGLEKNVWVEFIQLALENKPVNLGQGFPDFAAPDYVTGSLKDVVTGPDVLLNQYTRGFGHPRLIAALSKLYSGFVGRNINGATEIIVTVGAYEALFCSIMGHVNSGDEVIVIEPFFDCYEPMIRLAGGVPRFIPLRPKRKEGVVHASDFVLDEAELESMFNEKTKAIIVNTPHNPLGKVFTADELQTIANLCQKYNCLAIMDEVYEHMVFEGQKHIRMATLPGMWDRTITIGSAGKTFSVTGWKLGWAYGPAELIRNLQVAHQNAIYTCCTPIQDAVARAFELEMSRLSSPECYFNSISVELQTKRDFMVKFLKEAGMVPVIPEGGYFMLANWEPLAPKLLEHLKDEPDPELDYKLVKWMSKHHKLQGIPPSAFYCADHKNLGEKYIRFCFIKEDENLEKAAEILKHLKLTLDSRL